MKVALAVFVPLVVAYAVALRWVVESWFLPDSFYSHGPLMPAVAAVVLWLRRDHWSAVPARPDPRGWLLLGPGLALHAAGAALMIDSLSAASLVLSLPGAVWLAFGGARLRRVAPVVLLVVFAVPMPIFMTGRVAFELKEIAIAAALQLCSWLDLGVRRVGAELFVGADPQPLVVADACSGLRSLIGLTTLGYCVAFFVGRQSGLRRWVLLAATVPIAVLSNVLRITAICAGSELWGTSWGGGTGHSLLGMAQLVVALLLLMGLWLLLAPRSEPLEDEPLPLPPPARGLPRRSVLVLWAVAPLLLGLGLYRPFTPSRQRAAGLPELLPGFRLYETKAMTPRHYELLGTDDATWRTYVDDNGWAVYLVAVYHAENWKSVHPPRICLEGSNMSIRRDDETTVRGHGLELRVGRIVAHSPELGRDYLSLYLYGAPGFHTPSYLRFVLHHAPSALLRRSISGYLLRVETWFGSGGLAEAEQRCGVFLTEILPAADRRLTQGEDGR